MGIVISTKLKQVSADDYDDDLELDGPISTTTDILR